MPQVHRPLEKALGIAALLSSVGGGGPPTAATPSGGDSGASLSEWDIFVAKFGP